MAIENFKVGSRKDDIRILTIIIIIFVIVAWLLTPPGNKFIQVCFWGHNVQYIVTRIFDKNATEEYKFYWKNAIYLTQMDDRKALYEMNKAIQKAPKYLTEEQTQLMYRERAKMRSVFKDYRGALDDYLRASDLSDKDFIRIAILLNKQGKQPLALTYCNKLFNIELAQDDGYACVAETYASLGKYDSAIKVYDYAISRDKDVAENYIARAKYKKMNGDKFGESVDIHNAKYIKPSVKSEVFDIYENLLSKNVSLIDVF